MMGFYKTQYDDLKDSWLTYRNRTKELLKAARNAQRSWIKLRDQWVVTAKLLPFKSPAKKDIEASLKTRLTKGNL